MSVPQQQQGALPPQQMRRSGIVLTLRSDGQARATDTFVLRGDNPRAPPFVDPKNAYTVARPLPMTLVSDSVVFDKTPAPLLTFRVDESMWMLTDSARRMYGMTGERVRAVSKTIEWQGILVQGDQQRLIIYDPDTRVTSTIDRSHVISIDIQGVSPDEAAYFGRQKVCLMRFHPNHPVKPDRVVLSYDLENKSVAYSVQHSIVYKRTRTIDISSYVEVSNECGIDLDNASVKVIERRRDVQQPFEEPQERHYGVRRARAKSRAVDDSPRMMGGAGGAAEAMAPVALSQPQEAMQEQSRELMLTTPDVTFGLTQSSRTKIIAFDAHDVPANLRYDIYQDDVPDPGYAVADWKHYGDCRRCLKWPVAQTNAGNGHLLSGSVVARSERFGGQLLHDSPVALDAWETTGGLYSLTLGTSGLVKQRTYIESSSTASDTNIKTEIVRVDLLVTLREEGETANIKLVVRTRQPMVKPLLEGIYYRARPANKQVPGESDVASKANEKLPPNWLNVDSALARSEILVETNERKEFSDHRPEVDNAALDNKRKEVTMLITRTSKEPPKQDPYWIAVYYSMSYAMA